MTKALREVYLASLGVAALTYDKARDLSNELVKKGELAKEKQQKFIVDLLEESKKVTSEVSKIINEKVEYLAKKGEPIKEKQDKLIKDLQVKAKKTGTITEEKIKEVGKEVLAKGKGIGEKSQKIVEDIKQKSAKSDEEKLKEMLKKLDMPTKEDLDKINAKLDKLINTLASKEG